MPNRFISLPVLVSAVLLTATVAGPAPAAAPTAPATATAPGTVTLVTGDVVHVTEVADGRRSVRVDPAPGREDITVHQLEVDGRSLVIPSDAVELLAAGRLDRALFDVGALIEQGHTTSLPLIATGAGSAGIAATPAGAQAGPELASIGGRALEVAADDAAGFWAALTGPSATSLAGGIDTLWLDARVAATLDHSVPQIGAPAAWEAGLDGAGVTVAVLDTGVDAEHPDLAGQVAAAADFTGSPSTDDLFGHGTHVAATIAGTGDGGSPSRPGVAPGARILSGKVLGDDGFGDSSSVIAGMEWAVAQGADVVNLSLGGGPSDGTDPLSLAVNRLSAESDTLFVVSAGNDGPGAVSIGSPGSADAALTVGAVGRDESLAEFSSRGPRLGDQAVKPDITAPGVGIVAARAAGTTLGSPVDALYTAASGTSMAAPHVAGAAALLAQQHPDWTGEQLEDALVSTARPNPDLSPDEQGAGRVDLARAVAQPVVGTGGLALGTYADGDTTPVAHDVTYTNTSAAPVVLTVDLTLAGRDGAPPAPDAVVPGAEAVTVPAGGSATVALTVDPAALGRGRYTGRLVAASADGTTTVATTLWLVKSAPVHDVTISAVDREGRPAYASPVFLHGADPRYDTITLLPTGDPRTLRLGEGDYVLHALIPSEVDGEEAVFLVVDPDLEVDGDTEVVLDARETRQVEIRTPKPAEQRGIWGFYTHREVDGRAVVHGTMEFDSVRSLWVTPTDEATGGTFEFMSRWQLVAPAFTATAVGGARLSATPQPLNQSPLFDGRRTLEAVAAGGGGADDYAGLDVRGKAVVVAPPGEPDADTLAAAAAAAGAAMLLVIAPDGGDWPQFWRPDGDRLPLPAATFSPAEARAVAERLEDGPFRLRVDGVAVSPYLYDVMQVSSGHVPDPIVHTVSTANSAVVTAAYHQSGDGTWAKEQRYGWRPWQAETIIEQQRYVGTGRQREEYVSAGDTVWRQHVLHYLSRDDMNPVTSGLSHDLRTYAAGERSRETWFAPVVRPAAPAGAAPSRTGDTLALHIAEFADATHTGRPEPYLFEEPDLVEARLYEDDRLIAETGAVWGAFPVTGASGRYRLELGTERRRPDWRFAPRTDTAWTFRSERPAAGAGAVLPLLQVDYEVPAGLDNRVPARPPARLAFTVRHPDGLADPPRIVRMRAWVSYDDGGRWTPLAVRRDGDGGGGGGGGVRWTAEERGRGGEYVSLRVEAADADGNTVTQTVERAYGRR
ncbi:S8 family peptidase [Jiangella alba]|uniref:Subtilase family protein n=1 Tax=Jiangella alba TaxID=561176 RepID=A0A1H5HAN7_9ACTN|nr:S8 family serine peptidase [Jiangella alba]SEE25043.1 Subtilase family protein [Jiangella alba]